MRGKLKRLNTVQMRLIACFLAIMLVMFAVMQLLFSDYISYTRRALIDKTGQITYQIGGLVDEDVAYFRSVKINWLMDQKAMTALVKGHEPNLSDLYEISFQARRHINLLFGNSSIEGLHLYMAEDGYLLTLMNPAAERNRQVKDMMSFYNPEDTGQLIVYDGQMYMVNLYIKDGNEGLLGYRTALIFDLSSARWLKTLPSDGMAWFYDRDHGGLCTSTSLSADDMKAAMSRIDSGEDMMSFGAVSYVAMKRDIPNSRLTMYILNPLDEKGIRNIQGNFYLVFLLSITVLCVLFGIICYMTVHLPLSRLSAAFLEVEQGNYHYQVPVRGSAEIQRIDAGFNHMSSTLEYLIEHKYEEKMLLSEAELKMLQSQINPHFLYNSFFLMNSLVEMKEYNLLEKLTENLGLYFQYMFQNSGTEKTLEQEIGHAKAYAEVQRMRFGNRITITFDEMPEEWKDRMMPSMSVQPLVENAFQHGFSKIARPCRMNICFEETEDGLMVKVMNDVLSLTEDEISTLMYQLLRAEQGEAKSALCNIHRRMKILYGSRGGLHVRQADGGGFEVSFLIPREE